MPSSETLIVFMVRNAGMRRALKAAGYIASWGIAAGAIGHDPSWSEYQAYWKCSLSSQARESRAFKACFGEGVTVGDVWHTISRTVREDDREDAMARVMSARWSA